MRIEPLEDRIAPAVSALADFPFVDVGASTTFNVLTNDSNPDGTGLAVLSNTAVAPSGPTLTDNGDGTFTFESATTGTFSFDYTVTGAEHKVVASDAAASDNFGYSVAASGDTVVVGARYDDDGGSDSGSAYVFTRSGGTWTQQQKLTAGDAAAGDWFGFSVAISGDTAVVGAYADADGGSYSGSAYVFTRSVGVWTQQQKLTAGDAAAFDLFGYTVAVSGDTAVVGASGDDDGGSASGSSYVFTRSGAVWTQQQKLSAGDAAADDRFGACVAVSGDTALVGAYGDDDGGSYSGSAYVFTRIGGVWTQQQKLTAGDAAAYDWFGYSVALSGDTAVVGAFGDDDGGSYSGSAYVFTRSAGVWTQQQKLTAGDAASDDYFATSVSVSGDTVVIGANGDDDAGSYSGSAYVFTRSGGVWTQQQKLTAGDADIGDVFGTSVAVSGDTVVVGAAYDDDGGGEAGSAYIRNVTQATATVTVTATGSTTFDNVIAGDDSFNVDAGASTTFNVLSNDSNPDSTGLEFLSSTAVSPAGPTLTDNGDGTFTFQSATTGTFSFDYTITGAESKIVASDAAAWDRFGYSVAVSGDTVVVGAYGDDAGFGSAYVFTRSGGVWTQQQKLTASDAAADLFGSAVAVSGDTVVVGAYYDDDGGSNSGSAYVFSRSGGVWTQQQKLTASDAAADDRFGRSVAVSGDIVVVGSSYDDDAGNLSGSAYVFTRSGGIWTQQQKLAADDAAGGDIFGCSVAVSGDTVVVGARGDNSFAGSAYVFTRSGGTWTQQQKLTASDAAGGDDFGYSVAVSGDTVVVGAWGEDDGGVQSGSAYVFTRSGVTWTQQQKLTASDAAADDDFGYSVAVSGNTVVVGALGDDDGGDHSGSAYVFTRSGGLWTQQQKLTASDAAAIDFLGRSVAVSGDTAVVGAEGDDFGGSDSAGSAYIRNVTQATATVTVTANGPTIDNVVAAADNPSVMVGDSTTFSVLTNDSNPDSTGLAVLSSTALSPAGPTLTDNGDGTFTFHSVTTGAFSFDYTVTGAENKIVAGDAAAGDNFGYSVAVSGDTVVVGAYYDDDGGADSGAAYVFLLSGGVWTQQQKLTASDAAAGDWFGYSVAVSGDTLVIGAAWNDDGGDASGSAYVFARSGGVWTQQQKLTAGDAAAFDYFGISVAVSGDTAVMGAWGDGFYSGSAYVFTRSGTTWTQQQKLVASDAAASDYFGTSVAVNGDTAVVGALYDDNGGGNDSGSAYVFTRSGSTWTQQQKLTASDAAAGDRFGCSVALSGDTVAIGAYRDDFYSGSAYVFTRSGVVWTQQQKLTAGDSAAGDYFGYSVAASGDTVVVGAYRDNDGGVASGSAYVFTRSGVTWTQRQKLTASDAAANDQFGYAVALSGDTAVIGAPGDDDNGGESGSAYIRNVTQATATVTMSVFEPRLAADFSADFTNYKPTTVDAGGSTYSLSSLGRLSRTTSGVTTVLDNSGVASFQVVNGILYELKTNGRLWRMSGSTWTTLDDAGVVDFNVTSDGTLYELKNNGNLWKMTSAGWTLLDVAGATSFRLASDGTLYYLKNNGRIWRFSNSVFTKLDDASGANAVSIDLSSTGTLYKLTSNGDLRFFSGTFDGNGAAVWTLVASNIASFRLTTGSNLYALTNSGVLFSFAGLVGTSLDTDVHAIKVDRNGILFALKSDGSLKRFTNPTTSAILDTGVGGFALAGDGALYDIRQSGDLQKRNSTDTGWDLLDQNVDSLAVASNNSFFDLKDDGTLRLSDTAGLNSIASNVASLVVAGNGGTFYLQTDGALVRRSANNLAEALDTGVTEVLLTRNGGLHERKTTGTIRLWGSLLNQNSSGFTQLDTNVTDIALANNGTLYELKTDGSLRAWGSLLTQNTSGFTAIDSGIDSFALALDGTLCYLLSLGTLKKYNIAGVSQLAPGITSFTLADNGYLVTAQSLGGPQNFNV